jgi:ABC-type antimicrobial peptide transport system permease subunit
MRSIGFTAPTIVSLLSAEGALVGLLAGSLGAATAWVVLHLLPLKGELFGGLGTITMPAGVPIAAIALSLTIGILSALVPALIAMRRPIASELRAIV